MTFDEIVAEIRDFRGNKKAVPGFDPDNGNERAQILFLLEAPGPEAVESEKVSCGNDDATARNFQKLLAESKIDLSNLAIWNVVPWYLGTDDFSSIRKANAQDVQSAKKYLDMVIQAMPNLRCVVLVGAAARMAHVHLSHTTKARILSCHHTSSRALTGPRFQENLKVLGSAARFIAET